MIQFIKNLFKEHKKINISLICRGCGTSITNIIDDYEHICPLPKKLSLEEQTYEIFKATKSCPAIPEEGQSVFFNKCKDLTKDEVLDRVIDEVVGEYAETIIQTAENEKKLLELRHKMLGADEIRKRLKKYADSLEEKEKVDPYETI